MKATTENISEIINNSGILNDAEELDQSKPLADQGLDSLDLVNVYLQVEEKFGIKIPDEDLSNVRSVDEIVRYVNSITE